MIRITSPHLTIYQPQLNSFNSVFMRITGGLEFVCISLFILGFLFSNVLHAFYIGTYILSLMEVVSPYLISTLLLLTIFHFIFSVEYVNEVVSFVRPTAYSDFDAFSIEDFEFLIYCKLVVTLVLYISFLGFLFY